jgi:hypothetical protein
MCSRLLPDWHALPSSIQLKCETRCRIVFRTYPEFNRTFTLCQLRTPAVGKTGAAFRSWMSERSPRH